MTGSEPLNGQATIATGTGISRRCCDAIVPPGPANSAPHAKTAAFPCSHIPVCMGTFIRPIFVGIHSDDHRYSFKISYK